MVLRQGDVTRRLCLLFAASTLALAASAVRGQAVGGAPAMDAGPIAASVDTAVDAASDAVAAGAFIEFESDQLSYDDRAEIVTATGNVRLRRGEQRLTADTVMWNRATNVVSAEGDVLVIDADGNRLVADRMQLSDDLADGAIDNLLLVLEEGGRLAAKAGRREDGRSTVERAVYSPCSVIDSDTGCPQVPVWQLKAVRVIHDPVRGRIFYRNARLEFFGVPLVVLPSFSHPAGVDNNQSGLLSPDIRQSRELGLELRVPYFWAIAPDRDLTASMSVFSGAPPLLSAEYRQLFAGGPLVVGGKITYATSERIDLDTGAIVRSPERVRGYFDARGQLVHGNGWRSSFSSRVTNDDNFLGRYQVSLDNRLRSTYALERFSDNQYVSIAGWAFQGLRPEDRASQTPVALPLVDAMWRPDWQPGGGSVMLRANSLALYRAEGQSMARALASAQWDRRLMTPLGQRVTLTALLRGDLYTSRDSALADSPLYAGRDGWTARIIPLAAVDIDWPFAGPLLGGIQTLSPRVQLVASVANANVDVPNEDSRSVDLEDLNLFALNRFPGQDRWEGGARITYGVDWRWRGRGLLASAQVGQSYRLDDQSEVFPDGTGLSEKVSDIVGRFQVQLGRIVEVTQRVRLDKDDLAIRRNETDIAIGSRRSFVSVGYLKFNRNIALEDLVDHEEVRAGARVALGRYWSLFGTVVVDLTSRDEDPFTTNDGWQPIRHRLGVRYNDECFDIGVTWRRNYVDNPNARRGDVFVVSVALRNLG